MRTWIHLAALLTLLAFSSSLYAQGAKKAADPLADLFAPPKKEEAKDDKKDDKDAEKTDKDKKEAKDDSKKFRAGGAFMGKILRMGQSAKSEITLEVAYQMQVPNPSGQQELLRRQQDIARRQFDLSRSRNAQEYQQRLRSLQEIMTRPPPKLFDIKEYTREVSVRAADDMIVRSAYPEVQYDDKGNQIQMTPDLLKKMAGPEGYPGFPAELSAVKPNSYVRVYLAPMPKKKGDPKQKQPGAKSNKTEVDIADLLGENAAEAPSAVESLSDPNTPTAILIEVLKEG